MKKCLLLLLFLAVSIFLSAGLNQLRIVGRAERKPNAIVQAQYQTVNRERAACIIFTTDLTVDLDFRPRVELVALVNPASGQYHVYVAPGERVITVHASGYAPYSVVLRDFGISVLRSGEVYELQLTGDRADVRSIENINIVVTTQPRNAVVYLNENRVEDPRQILAPMGRNSIRIELDGYKSIIEEIEVSEQRTLFEYLMKWAMDVPVTIDTEPEGATVFLNDVNCGRTPLQFFYQEGEYNLRIVLENYAPVEEVIEIKEPQTVKSYNLEDIRGTLTIKTDPRSRIYINDKHYPQGVDRLIFPPQLVQIRITTPKAQDITRSIVIREREHQEMELYPQIDTGTIGINVMPVNARVELTGDAGERFSSQGSQTFREVPVGMYQLEIRADGHRTHRESFELKKEDVIRKQLFLEEGADEVTVSITSTPKRANIYANAKRLGRTPAQIQLPIGNNRLTLKRDDYLDHTRNIRVTEQSTEFSFEMRVNPASQREKEKFIKGLYLSEDRLVNTIIPFFMYDTKVSLFYFQNRPAISLPGLVSVTFILKEMDYQRTFSSFTWGGGVLDNILFITDEDWFWGFDALSASLGYFYVTNYHRVRFFWDVKAILGVVDLYGDEPFFIPLRTEINLEIFTGLRSFFVITAGLYYGGFIEGEYKDQPFKDGLQPYFGAGLRF